MFPCWHDPYPFLIINNSRQTIYDKHRCCKLNKLINSVAIDKLCGRFPLYILNQTTSSWLIQIIQQQYLIDFPMIRLKNITLYTVCIGYMY